jgi:G:T-mismatch repair DNA endonuclease (very short patch repair protein)
VESFVLGYKFETDCLVLSLPMPKDAQPQGRINRSPELVTLTEALLLGAVDLLEIESHELAAFSRLSPDADTPAEIVIYETVPGGAGYLDVLASRLPEVARIAMKRLYEHKCGGACYLCLKHYYNQYLHALLNKENIRWMLQALGDMAPASAENAKRGMAAKILNEDCRSRSAGVFATGRRPGTKGPQSPIEERLLVALRKVEGLPEPEAQFEVLKDGAPYTIPDFAYPDRKIAVFCDGYLFHGTPGTLELDAEKRNRLQVEGWKVLVFWGASINQNADVCARQVKQCWDVSLPLDAKTGRKN